MKDTHSTQKLESIITQISSGLYEKDNSIRLVLLSFLSGESAFMLGEPGTAKSLIARRVSDAFVEPTDEEKNQGVIKFFDYLMSRFSQPDEVFGPISINKLKSDLYERKTDFYLPKAKFAFLDEIWKANPSIQNALLTILNEHLFRNGKELIKVPLVGFVSASNELPEPGQGLEAIFDRFLIRILERPIKEEDNFFNMISSQSDMTVYVKDRFTMQELDIIRTKSQGVQISKECLSVISTIRKLLTIKNQEPTRSDNDKYIISDRRWKKIANLMKVSAYCNGRLETDTLDTMLIANCIWSTETQEKEALDIVSDAIVKDDAINTIIKNTQTFEDVINDLFYEEVPVKDGDGLYQCKAINNDEVVRFHSVPIDNLSPDNPVFHDRTGSYRLLYKMQERELSREKLDLYLKTQDNDYDSLNRDITEKIAFINKQLEYWRYAKNLFVSNHLRQIVVNELSHQLVVLEECSSRSLAASTKYHKIVLTQKISGFKAETDFVPLKLIDIMVAAITEMMNKFRMVPVEYNNTKYYAFKDLRNALILYIPTQDINQKESCCLSHVYKAYKNDDSLHRTYSYYDYYYYNSYNLTCSYDGNIYEPKCVEIDKLKLNGVLSNTKTALVNELRDRELQMNALEKSIRGDAFIKYDQKEDLLQQTHSIYNAFVSSAQEEFINKLEMIGTDIESKKAPYKKLCSIRKELERLEAKKSSINNK